MIKILGSVHKSNFLYACRCSLQTGQYLWQNIIIAIKGTVVIINNDLYFQLEL